MEQLSLQPIQKINGELNLPGSKSVSNRALLLAALAKGTTELTNLLDSDDVRHMLTALSELGVSYRLSECKTRCLVKGLGGAFTQNKALTLFLGNAGTVMRPLAAALCVGQGEYVLTGEPRMKERPIAHLVEALQAIGADVSYLDNPGYPPLLIKGGELKGGDVEIDGSISSQFLTAFLMAAPLFSGDTQIKIKGELVSKPYIDITLHLMKTFGIEVLHDNYRDFSIKGNQAYLSPKHFFVEGDASSASYFLAAAAIKGGKVKVTGVGKNSIQGDIRFADALKAMGAVIKWGDEYITAEKGELVGIDMDFNHIPDAAMTIATTALFAKGETVIRNVHNWRVKETDRLAAMATELRKVGAEVEEGEDYIKIKPPQIFKLATIDTYEDHRMAMCFSLVALSEKGVVIKDPNCTAKTFPDYFNQLFLLSTDTRHI